jgi:hypothetical protein
MKSLVHVTVTILGMIVPMKFECDRVDDRSIVGEEVETLCEEHTHMWGWGTKCMVYEIL